MTGRAYGFGMNAHPRGSPRDLDYSWRLHRQPDLGMGATPACDGNRDARGYHHGSPSSKKLFDDQINEVVESSNPLMLAFPVNRPRKHFGHDPRSEGIQRESRVTRASLEVTPTRLPVATK
jgi:hypothetical protein